MPKHKPKHRKLKNLRIDKISFVDVPAVGASQFVLMKREDGVPEEPPAEEVAPEVQAQDSTELLKAIERLNETATILVEAAKSLTKSQESTEVQAEPEPQPKKKPSPHLSKLTELVRSRRAKVNGLVDEFRLAMGKEPEHQGED